MDPFVRRLVQRLNDPARPLSRNRHFHTLSTPEGRAAVRTSRRLQSLRRDILACRDEGRLPRLIHRTSDSGEHRIELVLNRIKGSRVSLLADDELELLRELPDVAEALRAAEEAA